MQTHGLHFRFVWRHWFRFSWESMNPDWLHYSIPRAKRRWGAGQPRIENLLQFASILKKELKNVCVWPFRGTVSRLFRNVSPFRVSKASGVTRKVESESIFFMSFSFTVTVFRRLFSIWQTHTNTRCVFLENGNWSMTIVSQSERVRPSLVSAGAIGTRQNCQTQSTRPQTRLKLNKTRQHPIKLQRI